VPQTTTSTEPPEAPLEAGTQVYTYNPTEGDCFDRRRVPAGGTTTRELVLLLDCDLPHGNEVFAVIEYTAPPSPDGSPLPWPGDDQLRTWARARCPAFFEAYVGRAYELSEIEVGQQLPKEEDWPGDTTIACLLRDPAGRRMVGSLQGSAR
jgi:hypothetical protein